MPNRYGELVGLIAIIGGVSVAALIVTYLISRVFRKRISTHSDAPPFSLQELRKMQESGQINKQEYEAMRAALIGAAKSNLGEKRH